LEGFEFDFFNVIFNTFKENGNDQEPKCVPRKRRWGTALSTDTAPSFSISTDSLKVAYQAFLFTFSKIET